MMSTLDQKYFAEGDSLSSADYNTNVDNWDTATKTIGAENIRDQGLDIANFKANSCTDHDYPNISRSTENKLKFPTSATLAARTIYMMTIPNLYLGESAPHNFRDQRNYVFRTSLDWKFPMIGKITQLPVSSFARFEFKWFFQSDQTSPQLMTSKTIEFRGNQLSSYSGSGNITLGMVITPEMLDNQAQTKCEIKCVCHFLQSTTSGTTHLKVFEPGQTYDDGSGAVTLWTSNNVELSINNWQANLTAYKRAD